MTCVTEATSKSRRRLRWGPILLAAFLLEFTLLGVLAPIGMVGAY